MLVLVLTSGLLLGLSQRNIELTVIAAIGAIAGFIVTDWKQWFQLRGLFANIASVIVLIFAMKDFLGGDGASKLVSVSNLLVYLQTVLMFQEKTPRLNWQLLVLSLLQIVVAAIFNLNFEGGLMFVFYFLVAGVTLILQSVYANNDNIYKQNQLASRDIARLSQSYDSLTTASIGNLAVNHNRPIAIFDTVSDQLAGYRRVFQHLFLWLGVSLLFSTLLFYTIPRGEQAWFGPSFVETSATGISKQVDLNERGVIEPSAKLVMRVWFEKKILGKDEYVAHQLNGPVYFRGMALGNLTIVDDKTTWTAPYDRVFPSVYQAIRETGDWQNAIRQRITLQPTTDPLIYGAMPVYQSEKTLSEIEYCFEISAHSRRNGNDRIETTPYSYEFKTYHDSDGQLFDSWPYLTDHVAFVDMPMHTYNQGQYRWLTECDRDRYPTLVKIADQIAAENPSDRLQQMKAMEQYFSRPGLFQYTLDFTNVEFRDDIDPIEDFFGNHRSGHCELYASALTLMLRSQGIPARLVVGFYASEFNDDAKCYMVRESHAHAWVEAYLRPDDCSQKMIAEKSAGPGGAWLRLEPTPESALGNLNSSGNPIESARTLWQDYVLGLDSSDQDHFAIDSPSSRLLGLLDLSNWNQKFQVTSEVLEQRPVLRAGILLLVLLAVMFGLFKTINPGGKTAREHQKTQTVGRIRRLLGGALSLISPELGKWVMGGTSREISADFYRRLTRILNKTGNTRSPSQTHREFAMDVISKLAPVDPNDSIKKTITDVTEVFYQVRFGHVQLEKDQQLELTKRLNELDKQLSAVTESVNPV